MKPRSPIPTGLRRPAQGCRVREATLGHALHFFPQPQRGCITPRRTARCNPVGVGSLFRRSPRVARPSQPWAERRSPVGASRGRAVQANQSRTLATLRDTLLPKLLSGELSVAAVSASMEASA